MPPKLSQPGAPHSRRQRSLVRRRICLNFSAFIPNRGDEANTRECSTVSPAVDALIAVGAAGLFCVFIYLFIFSEGDRARTRARRPVVFSFFDKRFPFTNTAAKLGRISISTPLLLSLLFKNEDVAGKCGSAGLHLKPLSAACSTAWDALSMTASSACRTVLSRKLSRLQEKKPQREIEGRREEASRCFEQIK